jgi:hypothetical protein
MPVTAKRKKKKARKPSGGTKPRGTKPTREAKPTRGTAEPAHRVSVIELADGDLACGPGEVRMGFEVKWTPPVEATLETLHDNLILRAKDVIGRGVIAFRYCGAEATLHRLRWVLIGSAPLSNLTASAEVAGGAPQPLDKTAGPQLKWTSNGVAK